MALNPLTLPYGLRDVKIKGYSDAGVLDSTWTELPAGRTLSFSETEEFEELRGDDKVIAIRGRGAKISWSIESGGISLAAYKIMAGGTTAASGSSPAEKLTYTKLDTDARPYFLVEGQAISDSGGDFHVVLYKLRASDTLEGELSDGSFWLTSASGEGIGDDSGKIYEFVANETAIAIT